MSKKLKSLSFMSVAFLTGSAISLASIDFADSQINKAIEGEQLVTPADGEVINFNYDWQFSLGDTPEAVSPSYDDSSWRTLNLPHDWSIEQDFDSSIPAAMGKLPAGIGWYRKTFTVPEEFKDKEVYINFDGAYMNSSVYLNGKLLGNYPYGYTPFSYKLSGNLLYGGDQINTIAVRIDSPLGNGRNSSRWYAGAGINRDVTISVDEPIHFVKDGISIQNSVAGYSRADFRKVDSTYDEETAPEAVPTGENVETKISAEVTNSSDTSMNAKLRISLLDYNTNEVVDEQTWTSAATVVEPGKTVVLEDTHTLITTVKLWDTENPNLYNFKVEILDSEDKVIDTQIIRYGFRKVVFTKTGFYLNGKYLKIHGACMHHDQGSLGAVSYEESLQRQIRIMRDMGVNSIRTSHNVPASQMLKACDENGMLVFEEFFDTWTSAKNTDDYHLNFEQPVPTNEGHLMVEENELWSDYDIKMSVRRDRNNPSIIMWSIGNEIYDTNNGEWSTDTADRLIQDVRDSDPTRAITMGFPMWHGAGTALDRYNSSSWQVANKLDVVGLNYPGNSRYEKYGTDPNYSNWIVFGSENASAWKSRGVFDIRNGTVPFLDRQISSFDITNHFASQTDEWKWDRNSIYSLGEYIWTGFDYIGEPQPFDSGANSAKSSYYGSVDTAGFPKAEYYMLKSQWISPEVEPFVKIVNHINVDDNDLRNAISLDGGNTIQLWVSSNMKSVELVIVDDEGKETVVDRKDWKQVPVTEVGGSNPNMMTQEPEGNPSDYENKLYQIFTLNWSDVKGKKVIARAYDQSATEAAAAGEDARAAVASDEVVYSNGPEKVKLTPEKVQIAADGQALSYITVDITDQDGNIDPNASNEVYFTIKGDGEILGVDNGDPTSMERYKASDDGVWKRSAFMGKALIIVRSTREAGSITITARSDGLATGETTVVTVDPSQSGQSTVEFVAETVSYIAKVGITKEELVAMLPAQVNLFGVDGGTKQGTVVWDTNAITDEDLTHDNEIHITGTVTDYEGVTANAIISVVGQVTQAVQSIAVTTPLGTQPTLPNKGILLANDGTTTETEQITWDQIDANDLNYVGSFLVRGTYKYQGVDQVIYATVRVIEMSEEPDLSPVNVALNQDVSCNYSEGVHTPDQVTDGILANGNGWGNWQNHDTLRQDDWVEIHFAGSSVVNSANLLFLGSTIDHAWIAPDSVKIEYLNSAGVYQEVSNVQGNALGRENFNVYNDKSYTADPNDYFNTVTFDQVQTTSLRFTFHFDNIDDIKHDNNGDNTMLKVSEIQVMGYTDPLAYYLSNEALLGDLKVDGQTVAGFSPFTTNYTYALNKGEDVPVVTADAALNGRVTILNTQNPYGKTLVMVRSEDGTVTQTYTIQFVVND